jgi:uracil-DNA glycosylase family 4
MPDATQTTAILPDPAPGAEYDQDCARCARLASFLAEVRGRNPGYFCRPVPPFGPAGARLVVVGLAPGMHGANASGRPFTGDHAGILLYATLHAHGFATQAEGARRDDGLALLDCRVTNAVKCLPPDNKPSPAEVRACNGYLAADLARLPDGGAVLALGRIAHDAALRAFGQKPARFAFAHGARHALGRGRALFDSYHCSRYNTNTRRLTAAMFDAVIAAAARHVREAGADDGR